MTCGHRAATRCSSEICRSRSSKAHVLRCASRSSRKSSAARTNRSLRRASGQLRQQNPSQPRTACSPSFYPKPSAGLSAMMCASNTSLRWMRASKPVTALKPRCAGSTAPRFARQISSTTSSPQPSSMIRRSLRGCPTSFGTPHQMLSSCRIRGILITKSSACSKIPNPSASSTTSSVSGSSCAPSVPMIPTRSSTPSSARICRTAWSLKHAPIFVNSS